MLNQHLGRMAEARHEAEQMLAEGYAKRLPIGFVIVLIDAMLVEKNIPVPEDTLAFVFGGKISDSMITDPSHPAGGV